MPISIHGKEYIMVHERIALIHKAYDGNVSIVNEIVKDTEECVIFKSTVTVIKEDGLECKYTGFAQEVKNSTQINTTSPYENCETSAVGRAIGMASIGIDTGMATGNEVINAKSQEDKPITPGQLKYLESLCEEHKIDIKQFDLNDMTLADASTTIDAILKKSHNYKLVADHLDAENVPEVDYMDIDDAELQSYDKPS